MTFGQQVLSTRQALNLTQAELARALERTTQTVSNWECEATAPWPRAQAAILSRLLEMQRGDPPPVAVPVPSAPVRLPSRRASVGDQI